METFTQILQILLGAVFVGTVLGIVFGIAVAIMNLAYKLTK